MDISKEKSAQESFNFEKEASEIGSFSVTRDYSDFRNFLVSERLYLMSFASDDGRSSIETFLDTVFYSVTWKEMAQRCNCFYEDNKVEAFLKALWRLYPFLCDAYYLTESGNSSNGVKIFRNKKGENPTTICRTFKN